MGDFSICKGFVEPAGSLEELIEALKEKGFVVDDYGLINSPDGDYTGFDINKAAGVLVARAKIGISSSFDAFVEALQELSPLIASAIATKEGIERNDHESYGFDGSQWYVNSRRYVLYTVQFLVPADRRIEAYKRLVQVAKDLRHL